MQTRERECDDSENETRESYFKTLDECAAHCKGYAGMFIYAFAEDRRSADGHGYRCYCETSPGTKTCTEIYHASYNLYKFT